MVENLQREDIHPLEEALGFRSLLELGEPAYTIATIASRAGKSEAYVHGRIRLTDLIPPVAEAFLKDQITIGHALLIAKLPASQQQEAFSAAFRGLWTSEGNSQVLIPVRELAAWIESNILLELASAPFGKQDETLVQKQERAPTAPSDWLQHAIFPRRAKDSCTSSDCFRAKLDARRKDPGDQAQANADFVCWNSREGAPSGATTMWSWRSRRPKPNGSAKLSPAQKPCEKMTEAIVMDGGKRGQAPRSVPIQPAASTTQTHLPPNRLRENGRKNVSASKKEAGNYDSPPNFGCGPPACVGAIEEGRLLTVVHYFIDHSPTAKSTLGEAANVETEKSTKTPQELLAKRVTTYDEAALCRILLEISLFDSAYKRSGYVRPIPHRCCKTVPRGCRKTGEGRGCRVCGQIQ